MKHYLLQRSDGGITLLHMIEQPDGSYSTPEVDIAKWDAKRQAEITSCHEIKREEIPDHHYVFRDAWCYRDLKITVDMPKARNIHRDKLRALRAPKLADLDIEMIRGWQDPQAMKDIEVKKQALRDVTIFLAIDVAKTPEELVKAVPDILK